MSGVTAATATERTGLPFAPNHRWRGQPLRQEGGELLDQSIHELSSGGVIENQ